MAKRRRLSTHSSFILCCSFFLGAISSHATQLHKVESILALDTAPPGVVFEIITGHKNGLRQLLPQVNANIEKLHTKFPNLPVAVVSHGDEMLALQTSKQQANPEVVSLTQSLVKQGVPVHVCGTYASMKGLSEEDFPAFVNVSAYGPAQIQDYIAVGYLHVKFTLPKK